MRWRGLVLIATGLWGCLLGDLVVEPGPAGTGGTGGGSADGGAGGTLVCASARWPERPDAAGSDGAAFVVAVRRLDFGEGDLSEGPRIAYDLDGRCTCRGQESACTRPDYAEADDCDGPEGRDNNVARLVAATTTFTPSLSSESLGTGLEAGAWSLLIHVRGFDGTPDDGQVSVAIHPSPGFTFDPCNPDGAEPDWDGQDRWPVHAFSVEIPPSGDPNLCGTDPEPALEQPAFVDDNAYVADGTLVASLPVAGLTLSGGDDPVTITLAGGFITAHIVDTPTGLALKDGRLVGRWPSQDVLGALAAVADEDGALCTEDGAYGLLKAAVCNHVDIATSPSPTALCDAISFGIAFEAEPAQLGVVYEGSGPTTTCPPGEDPADDTCE